MSLEVIMLMGCQASGKSTVSQQYVEQGYVRLNRDTIGGKLADLVGPMTQALQQGKSVILDNTHLTVESRVPFLVAAAAQGAVVKALVMETSIEDCQFNAALRIYQKRGQMLSPDELKKSKDPNIFPTVVLFGFKKKFEPPTVAEGFVSVDKVPFVRTFGPEYVNKALILDYDGTLRRTKSGADYPTESSDIEILPGRSEVLQKYKEAGYRLLGVSNQSGVHKGSLSNGAAKACFEKTNQLLGHEIEYVYCPHQSAPISCYCRKPMSGHGVMFIEKYKLNRNECIMVGDMTTDKTFAARSGFQYVDQGEFFA
jgi:HAD superfamily hydrolase (TIGR01662 family)